ncbi:MAG: class II glutamine amidotransferase [Planctomycetota bacterium]|nr:class II glutamine amidotransferase [Planctomycetota bacterium]
MCRFVLYLGPPLTLASLFVEPDHSLINQSVNAKEREEPLNGDGFGVAWWKHDISLEPAAFRSVSPAWSNRNLLELARVTRSGTILAHVRAATQNLGVSEFNCHPFTRGRYAFMHNGDVGAFHDIRRLIRRKLTDESYNAVHGSTDSEHLFALFMDRLPADEFPPMVALGEALVEAINEVVALARSADKADHSYINIAISDGNRAVACRFTTDIPEHADTLYLNTGRRYICEDGVCRMIEPEEGEGAVLIASEPLSDDPGWQMIPVNHVVLVNERREVQVASWAELS